MQDAQNAINDLTGKKSVIDFTILDLNDFKFWLISNDFSYTKPLDAKLMLQQGIVHWVSSIGIDVLTSSVLFVFYILDGKLSCRIFRTTSYEYMHFVIARVTGLCTCIYCFDPKAIYDVFQVNGLEVDKYAVTGQLKVLVV